MKAQSTAKLRGLRKSPRKVRLIIDAIRGKKVAAAYAVIARSPKHAALPVKKLLDSAIANAKQNHGMEEKTLMVKEAYVDGGPILYRWMPRAMGRATPIRKRTSHVTIVLEGEAKEQKDTRDKKQETNKTQEAPIAEESKAAEVKPKKKVSKPKSKK